MNDFPCEVGDTIVAIGKDATFEEGVLLARHPTQSAWLIEITKHRDPLLTGIVCRHDWVLDVHYATKRAFFEVGKKYRYEGSKPSTIYSVVSAHHLDKPFYEGYGKAAVSIATREDGKQDVALLYQDDFCAMIEAQDG